jgi:RNA polymerase sigma-70 factor (ECF subfamily)
MLYAFSLRLQGDVDDANDVVQEAWLRAVRAFGGFAWKSSLRTWLSGIVLNCCRERWMARGESLALAPDLPVNRPDDADLRVDLERALASLPTGYRTVVVLHDIEGYTHEEIAKELGITSGGSKSQLFKARAKLRRLLAHLVDASSPAKDQEHVTPFD